MTALYQDNLFLEDSLGKKKLTSPSFVVYGLLSCPTFLSRPHLLPVFPTLGVHRATGYSVLSIRWCQVGDLKSTRVKTVTQGNWQQNKTKTKKGFLFFLSFFLRPSIPVPSLLNRTLHKEQSHLFICLLLFSLWLEECLTEIVSQWKFGQISKEWSKKVIVFYIGIGKAKLNQFLKFNFTLICLWGFWWHNIPFRI